MVPLLSVSTRKCIRIRATHLERSAFGSMRRHTPLVKYENARHGTKGKMRQIQPRRKHPVQHSLRITSPGRVLPLICQGSNMSKSENTASATGQNEAASGSSNELNLVWVDMEMTGLDPVNDVIIEVALVVTDSELNILAKGPVLAIHQSDAVLDAMDDWNKSTHGKSGLIDRVRASTITEAEAEEILLEFMKPFVPARTSPMCGNSICQDRRFMAKSMPKLEAYFHYRNLDVSSLKELCRRWMPEIEASFKKDLQHTAQADILESIAELRYYQEHFIVPYKK